MKIRTIVISVGVSGALVAGVVYAAYYSLQKKSTPVEVVPVANVDQNAYGGWLGTMDSAYGTVTSKVSQNITLEDEYSIEEIYVSAGDEVKKGDALFSYDMTLQELELEMEELNLEIEEISLKKLQKDLEKYQATTATASLSDVTSALQFASSESVIDAEEENGTQNQTSGDSGGQEAEDSDTGVSIDGIETVPEGSEEIYTEEQLAVRNSVFRYEKLIAAIHVLYANYGEELKADDIGEELQKGVDFYRSYLADRKEKKTIGEDGTSETLVSYALKDSVKAVLSADEADALNNCISLMQRYEAAYVDLLIGEAEGLEGETLRKAAAAAKGAYEELETAAQRKVTKLDALNGLLEQCGMETVPAPPAEDPEEDETESESESGREEQSESDSEVSSELQTESESQSEASSETQTEGESESETSSETQTESESQSESSSETQTESESQSEDSTEPQTGETSSESESETETESGTETESEPQSETAAETETETETENPEDIETEDRIQSFLTMADSILADYASPSAEDYVTAINLYQMYIGEGQSDIVDGSERTKMGDYELSDRTLSYLDGLGTEGAQKKQELTNAYQKLCMAYVKFMVTRLEPGVMTREELTAAEEAYQMLGTAWTVLLEDEYQEEQAEAASEAGGDGADETTDSGESVSSQENLLTPTVYPSLEDRLIAYDVALQIEEIDLEAVDTLMETLQSLQQEYLSLTETQMTLVWNADSLIELLREYGLWEDETETEWPYDGGDDYWGDDSSGYTAEELKELIEETQREIKSSEIEIRQCELDVKQKQEIVDKKVVRSTVDGTVVSIGSVDGTSDDDYFAKVTSTTGLYARGVISELALDTVNVGDTISGTSENGMAYTAVITEVSDYPDPDGSEYASYSGTENTNVSYYAFYAEIDDPEGIDEGWTEIQFSADAASTNSNIWLETYFVRTDNVGKSYVYVEGADGLLTKREVTTGKTYYSYYIEITSGLESTDYIAFPYGDKVKEGAQTTEVDVLTEAYGS